MTETLTNILTGTDPGDRVFLLVAALVFVGFVVSQLVALVRVVLDRETIDSDDADPQLAEVIDRLDSLCKYAHDADARATRRAALKLDGIRLGGQP